MKYIILITVLLTACGAGTGTDDQESPVLSVVYSQEEPEQTQAENQVSEPEEQPEVSQPEVSEPEVAPVAQELEEPEPTITLDEDYDDINYVSYPLVEPAIYAQPLQVQEWRTTGSGAVLPWTVSSLELTWDLDQNMAYYLVYDGEEVPGAITSPWTVTHEHPGSQEMFDNGILPSIQIRTCTQVECMDSPVINWGL